jgi:BRCA1-A complex subunit BRE
MDNSPPLVGSSVPFYQEQIQFVASFGVPPFKFDAINNEAEDRSTLKIPYCSRYLQWEVIFNAKNTNVPPDFIFEEGEEFFAAVDKIIAMKKWTANNPRALLTIVLELLELYKDYQKQLIQKLPSERLHFEFSTIGDIEGVEFLLVTKEQAEVHCLIPITDLKPSSSETMKKSLQQHKLRLYLTFFPNSDKVPERRLIYPPKSFWDQLLSQVKLPLWSSDMCTVNYLPLIKQLIVSLEEELQLRKKLITALRELFGTYLESDTYNYQKVSFQFEHNQLPFVAIISISSEFPSKQPMVTFVSVLQQKSGKPLSNSYNNYPYSPRWPVDELAKRLKAFIIENIAEFKKLCNDAD